MFEDYRDVNLFDLNKIKYLYKKVKIYEENKIITQS